MTRQKEILEARRVCAELDTRLAQDVRLFRPPPDNGIAEYLIVATAVSRTHLNALEGYALAELKRMGHISNKPSEGRGSPLWRILDAGFMIIHLMTREARERYHVENVWSSARSIPLSRPAQKKGKHAASSA